MNKRLPVLTSLALFIALCASVTYWTLQFVKPPQRALVIGVPQVAAEVPLDAAQALFGGRAAAVAVASNFQLKGVVFAGNARDSVAILGADGKPPQASRVNSEVQPGVTVQEVHRQYVLLNEGGTIKRVELQEAAKNSMMMQEQPAPSLSQSVGQVGVQPQRLEAPPIQPTQMAPAMPPTMVVAPTQPPMQNEPPPNPGQNIPNPGQPLTNGQEAPPGVK